MPYQYGGNFSAVGGFSFLGGKDFGGGGNFSAVSGFSFFGGNNFGGAGETKMCG